VGSDFDFFVRLAKNQDLTPPRSPNILNANPVLTLNNALGAWLTPQSILDARLFRIGAQFDF
jgi:hypothetical protein